MSSRKVYQTDVIDGISGEILQSKSVFVRKSEFVFGMFNLSDRDWICELSGDELKLLMLLFMRSDYEGLIVLSKESRELMCGLIRGDGTFVSGKTLSRLLNGLISKGVLKQVRRFEYLISPSTFFRGGSNGLADKIIKFDDL